MRLPQIAKNLIMLLFLLTIASSVLADPQIGGSTVLRRMIRADNTVSFIAHQVTTLSRGASLTSEQDIYRVGFKRMRMEYTSPASLRNQVMVDDGRQFSHYIPSAGILSLRPSMLAVLHNRVMQTVQASKRGDLAIEVAGNERIAGRNTVIIVVRPVNHKAGLIRKFWVDTGKWVKLRMEDITPNGDTVSTSCYTKIEFVDSIPEAKFRIETPAGTKVKHDGSASVSMGKARKMVGFGILEPKFLPAGFKIVGVTVRPFRSTQLVAVRYTDGISSFSIFQTPGSALKPGFRRRLHGGPVSPEEGVYSWKVGGLNLTIVGQIPSDQMERIAQSVK